MCCTYSILRLVFFVLFSVILLSDDRTSQHFILTDPLCPCSFSKCGAMRSPAWATQ